MPFTVTMHVEHGQTHLTTSGTGKHLHEAFMDTMNAPVARTYGPTSNVNKARVLDSLARHGKAQHGWADFTVEED